MMGWGLSRRKIYALCLTLTNRALQGGSGNSPKPVSSRSYRPHVLSELITVIVQIHMVQWTAEAARIRDAADVAKMALGLVFASAFQVPIVGVLLNLLRNTLTMATFQKQLAQSSLYRICSHPQYLGKLKVEARESLGLAYDNNNREMPYMDSFVKESARLGAGPIREHP